MAWCALLAGTGYYLHINIYTHIYLHTYEGRLKSSWTGSYA